LTNRNAVVLQLLYMLHEEPGKYFDAMKHRIVAIQECPRCVTVAICLK